MWKFQNDSRKECALIPLLNDLFLPLFLVLFIGCAPKAPVIQPQIPPVHPSTGLELQSNPYFDKGFEEFRKGNQEKARGEYARSLKQFPNYYPAWMGIAYTYLSEKNTDAAERYIRTALEKNPDYALAHFELGHIYEARQEYENALASMQEVQRIDPEFPSLAESLNLLKLKATEKHLEEGRRLADSDPTAAIEHLKAAHNLAPEIGQIPAEIASILLKENNCAEASSYLEIAIQKTPEDISIKKQFADCLLELKEYQKALTTYQELTLQDPADGNIRKKIDEIQKLIYVGSLPAEYQTISTTPEITRGQFSAYLVLHLDFLKRFESQDSRIIVDTIDHWARNYIQKTVNLGILDTFPNRTFQPNQPMSKLELSKATSRVLELLEAGGKSIPRGPAEIPDVPAGNVYYRMIEKSVSAGVVTLDTDGRFHPYRKVSGAEAISVVNRLLSIMEAS